MRLDNRTYCLPALHTAKSNTLHVSPEQVRQILRAPPRWCSGKTSDCCAGAPGLNPDHGWRRPSLTRIQDAKSCRCLCNVSSQQEQEIPSGQTLPKIWFVESSLRNETCLNEREACSVESAALRNPTLTVNLLITGSMANNCSTIRTLSILPNFRATIIDVRTEFQGTPLEPWYKAGTWKTAKNKVADMSDALRWLILWKRGGIYLDLDVIVLKPLKDLKNGGAFEPSGFPGTAAMFFEKQHPFLGAVHEACIREYNNTAWGSCGPTVFNNVYKRWTTGSSSPVRILPTESFYTINYGYWHMFFSTKHTAEVLHAVRNSFGVHVWNKMSRKGSVQVGSGTAYDILARFNCPLIYESMVSRKWSEILTQASLEVGKRGPRFWNC
uniref:Alpha 1,4-glycosyltransferase domain-containing protein n=1 Tax=Amblyomma maculatum TaxID=34609 RepID=G3MQP5_AMBMU